MLVRVRSPRSAPLFLEEEENGTVPRCAEPVDRSCDKRRGFVSQRAIGAREGQREKEVKMVRERKAERRKKGESASHLLGDLRGRGVPSFLYQPLPSLLSSLDLSREFRADYGESARHPLADVLRSSLGECIFYPIAIRIGLLDWKDLVFECFPEHRYSCLWGRFKRMAGGGPGSGKLNEVWI